MPNGISHNLRWCRTAAECPGFVIRLGNRIVSSNLTTSFQSFQKTFWLSVQHKRCRRSVQALRLHAGLPANKKDAGPYLKEVCHGSPVIQAPIYH